MKKPFKKISKIILNLFLFLVVGFLLSSSDNFNIFNYKTYTVSAQVNADAIGIRVIPNPNHLDPQVWYRRNFFIGSPSRMKVDGYEAIRDGRSVYVNVGNEINPTTLETYIYIISYNQDVEPETVIIYESMLDNWKFNTNIDDSGVCGISSIVCKNSEECSSDYECLNDKCAFPAGDEPGCHIDSDCPVGIFCNSNKAKVTRDVKRLSELTLIEERLAEYKNAKGQYPVLSSGSYLPYKTISVWPSWQDELGRMLGVAIPVDPINALGDCGSDNFSPVTCWDKEAISFAGNLNSPQVLPIGSRIFFYNTTNPYNYELCAAMETASPVGPYTNLSSNACSSLITANSAPNLTVGALNGHPNSSFEAFVSYSDPEGDAVDISSLSVTGAWGGIIPVLASSSANLLRLYTPLTAPNTGSYNFNITVADIYGATVTRTITINLGNQAPVIDLSSCSTINAINQFYNCNFNYFDPEGDTLTTIIISSPPAGVVVDFASSTISGTSTVSGTFPITIRVQDSFGATATGTYQLIIANKVCGDGIIDNPNDFGVIEVCDGPGGGTGPGDQYGCSANCLSWQGGYCGDGATQYNHEQCDKSISSVSILAMEQAISYQQGSSTGQIANSIKRLGDMSNDRIRYLYNCDGNCNFNCGGLSLTVSTDGDPYHDCFDNCPSVPNIGQFDADQDNVGDLCDDCYNWNTGCVELTIQQGAFNTIIRPYVGRRSAFNFYCLSGVCDACSDTDPYTLCNIFGASSNMAAYQITDVDRSEIFAYIDATNPLTPMLSLGFVHDQVVDGGGGSADFSFSGDGWNRGVISVSDDAGEFNKAAPTPGNWNWLECCTDGGMIDIDYLNNGWSLIATPNPGFTYSATGTISQWFAKNPGDINSGTTLPSTSTPITITYIPN